MSFLIVFFGGGLGAALRHGVNLAVGAIVRHRVSLRDHVRERHRLARRWGCWPAISRSAAARASHHWQLVPHHRHSWRLHHVLGVLARRGAALRARRLGLAAVYVLGSVLLSIAGLVAGLALARHVF